MANTLPPQYNVDEKTRLRLLEKANRRAQLREEFLKLRFDPFRHASGQGGYVFDEAMMRHQAMKVSLVEHFRPSSRTIINGLTLYVLPVAITIYLVKTQREKLEQRYRRGEVAYRDRNFKFV